MSKTINDWYKEKRAVYAKAKDLKELADREERLLSQEEQNTWEELRTKMEDIQKNIDVLEQMNEIRKSMDEPVFNGKGEKVGTVAEKEMEYRDLVHKWMRKGNEGLTPEERRVLSPKREGSNQVIELRAIGALVNPSYTYATDVVAAIETAKKYYGGWLAAADEIRTEKGNPLTWPTADDTSYTGALEAAGTDAFTSSDAVTLGYKQLSAYIYSSQGVGVANDALEDADFDLSRAIGDILGERLWRAISTACTTGTGSSQPQGIAHSTAAAKGFICGGVPMTRARLLQLIGTVDYAYHLSPSCGWMMHSTSMYDIAGLAASSTDYRPLWQPSMAAGVPDKIEGFPYWINNDLTASTATAATARHILFGDFKKFKIRYAGPTMLIRLNELYAAQFQTGFMAVQRVDSKLLAANATTYSPVKWLRKTIGT